MIALAERGWLPDGLIRIGIRRLLRRRVRIESARSRDEQQQSLARFEAMLRAAPIAINTDSANEQHYEVPPGFFARVLGPHLKYSCGWWDRPDQTLEESEQAMLQLTVDRAQLEDGMRLLDIGCGWGSLSLYMARRFPASQVTGISNSTSQRNFILDRARKEGLTNLQIITADMREFDTPERFDRALSIEMFEHMRNYELLLKRIASWLHDGGKLFVHIFCHRELAYAFETDGENDWMARHFFTGGLMPSADLFSRFSQDMCIRDQWKINGKHYTLTCEAWLERLDSQAEELLRLFQSDMQPSAASVQLQRWRMFFMACAELFGFHDGEEWFVSHYLFDKIDGHNQHKQPPTRMSQ